MEVHRRLLSTARFAVRRRHSYNALEPSGHIAEHLGGLAVAQTTAVPTYRELTREEARDLFDELARHHLNMTGEEFLRAWDAGQIQLEPERPAVMEVVFHLPLVR